MLQNKKCAHNLWLRKAFYLVAKPNLDLLIPTYNRIGLMNSLLSRTLCSFGHFAPQHCLLFTCCSLKHFSLNTLHLGKLCFLKHFASQHTLLPGTLCSLEYFSP